MKYHISSKKEAWGVSHEERRVDEGKLCGPAGHWASEGHQDTELRLPEAVRKSGSQDRGLRQTAAFSEGGCC